MNRTMARLAVCSATALAMVVIPEAAGATTAQAVRPTQAAGPSMQYQQRQLGFDAIVNDVNDVGVVVGESAGHAFSWNATTKRKTDLGTLGGYNSVAYGINDSGQIVGTSDVAGVRHAFLWKPRDRRMTDLGTLGGDYSTAFAINNLGVVVGESDTAGGVSHPFRWDPRTRHMTDLGTLGGDSSTATAINDRGQIVGYARTSEFLAHAFLWDPHSKCMQDLGLLPNSVVSFATGINIRGEVVGYTNDVGDFTDRAFRWDPQTRKMSTIPGVPDVYSHATGINDVGQIAGYWDDQSGRTTPFVWNPVRRTPTVLPQSSTEPFSFYTTTSAINNRSWVAGDESSAVLWIPQRERS